MANNKMNIEGKNYSDVPVWRRYTLTIEEAARYYHIGEGKLRTLIDTHPETSCQGLFIKKISNSIICCTMLVVYVIWLYN